MYAEAIDDGQLRILAFEDRWHFVALLCLKAQGVLDEPDETLRKQAMCIKLGLDSTELETVMKRLISVRLVSSDYQPINWGKRQFISDSSTNRVRAFRKRFRNVPETHQSRAETDTEQSRAEKEGASLGLDEVAWKRFSEYRRASGKPIRPASLEAARKKLASHGMDQAAVVEQTIANGWQGLFALPRKTKQAQPWAAPKSIEQLEAEERPRGDG